MSTTIYYFSATGNSLTTAEQIADALDADHLIPAASTRKEVKIEEQSDTVGFVFPVYYGDMPYPIRELVSKLVFQPDTYIFIVTTYRGHAGDVAKRMDQLLKTRGQKLSLAAGLPMPGNSYINAPEVDQSYLDQQQGNIQKLLPALRAKEVQDYATCDLFPLRPVDYPNNFRGIMAEDHCTGCGTCRLVCPMDNIQIIDKKAVIGDHCATCLACFHWCPLKAIYMSKQENIARRSQYHHPDVMLGDIVAQKMGL